MRFSVLPLAALVVLAGPATPAQPADTSVKALLAAADAYLSGYQKQLTYLLADERYTQRVLEPARAQPASRSILGELFVTFVPADRAWIAVHDFAEVDGRPVADREDLRQLLARNPIGGVARQLITRNARFNIGSIIRNFNEPTLGLLVLDPARRRQFTFERTAIEREGGVAIATMAFREAKRPTLVRGVDGTDVPSRGELSVEAGTGRIRRTSMQFAFGRVTARLVTTYALEPKLGLWVPTAFSERYERTKDPRELILCEATYTNWRRFVVDVKIR